MHGLAVTGLSRDVSWGLYIAQFTFFVGVAVSAVMVVLPYYLHDYRQLAASPSSRTSGGHRDHDVYFLHLSFTWASPRGFSTSCFIPSRSR